MHKLLSPAKISKGCHGNIFSQILTEVFVAKKFHWDTQPLEICKGQSSIVDVRGH